MNERLFIPAAVLTVSNFNGIVNWFNEAGAFIGSGTSIEVTPGVYYAKSLTIDFWTGAIAGTFFVLVEGNRLKMKLFWLFPLVIILIGFAFGFPLFLYFRHKKIIAQNKYKKPDLIIGNNVILLFLKL